jgi:hypothetical protein
VRGAVSDDRPYRDPSALSGHNEDCELDAETFRVTSVRDDQGEPRFDQPPGKLTMQLRRLHRRREKAF